MNTSAVSTDTTASFCAWIALDMPDFFGATELVAATRDIVAGYKVHALLEDDLRRKVERLRTAGADNLWHDRKACDTPDTVALIAQMSKNCGFSRMTVHANGGIAMMMAAVAHGPDEIVAITDLTSLSKVEIGILGGMPADSSTLLKAQWASLAGVTHIVCSGLEVEMLNGRRAFNNLADRHLELHGINLVVPGSRTTTDDMGSQQRSGTAMDALSKGADELVLGSEVWKAEDPRAKILKIYQSVREARGAA